MTTYVVSYNLDHSSRLHTFRCDARDRRHAMEQCLAFNPGVLVIGVYTEEEIQQHP